MAYLKQLKKHKRYRSMVEILDTVVQGIDQLNWFNFEEIAMVISKKISNNDSV